MRHFDVYSLLALAAEVGKLLEETGNILATKLPLDLHLLSLYLASEGSLDQILNSLRVQLFLALLE